MLQAEKEIYNLIFSLGYLPYCFFIQWRAMQAPRGFLLAKLGAEFGRNSGQKIRIKSSPPLLITHSEKNVFSPNIGQGFY
jgi:hypothetical protein